MTTLAPSQQDLANFFDDDHNTTNSSHQSGSAVSSLGADGRLADGRLMPFSVEILEQIVEYAYYMEDPAKKETSRTKNINSLAQVNSIFYMLTLKYRYRYCKFIRSNMFYRFLLTLMNNNDLGRFARTLDFQEFTSVGLGRSGDMMLEIQDLTARTILECLRLTPNLREFLSSESMESDISEEIVDHLFNHLPSLESIDFCGSTGQEFSNSFAGEFAHNTSLRKLSLHECTDLTPQVLNRLISSFKSIERLDLTHTLVSAKDLKTAISPDCRLTHLSLSKCFHIGATHDLITLLVNHPAINHEGLQWLNLQNDWSIVLLKGETITYLLRNLKSKDLRYLNVDGYSEIWESHLAIIAERFPKLQSLAISRLKPGSSLESLGKLENLRYLDISVYATSKSILDRVLACSSSLEVVEIGDKLGDNLPHVFHQAGSWWRVHNSSGLSRRMWVHRVDSPEDSKLYDNYYNNRVYFNVKTGERSDGEFKKPTFMKYASRKVNVSNNRIGETDEDIFPNTMCERGLYRYYALHK